MVMGVLIASFAVQPLFAQDADTRVSVEDEQRISVAVDLIGAKVRERAQSNSVIPMLVDNILTAYRERQLDVPPEVSAFIDAMRGRTRRDPGRS